MSISPSLFPELIQALIDTVDAHGEQVTALDQAIGDGDHVFNLQRGLNALREHADEIAALDWSAAWQKIGMLVMAAVGGASGSLYATLFLTLAKNTKEKPVDLAGFAEAFELAVDAVKQRGKADVGEKTMLDVWVPVARALRVGAEQGRSLPEITDDLAEVAAAGAEATRDMLATKGRASFLGERSKGHIDAGAKTAELMVASIAGTLKKAR